MADVGKHCGRRNREPGIRWTDVGDACATAGIVPRYHGHCVAGADRECADSGAQGARDADTPAGIIAESWISAGIGETGGATGIDFPTRVRTNIRYPGIQGMQCHAGNQGEPDQG